MSKQDVKILGAWPSPFVMRPRIALNLKGVDYDFIQESMSPKSDLLLKSNPVYKKIPVLIHADKPVCESLIIVQYIDEAWSSVHPILPSHPYDRATARFWASYIDDKWFPGLRDIGKAQTDDERKAAIEQVLEGTALLEEAYAKCSLGKPFFGGDKIGYIDIALGCYLGWLRVTERNSGIKILDEEKAPGLAKWAEIFCSDPAVKDVMPETEKLAEFAKVVMARFKAEAAGQK
ncbi:hypothetical protein MLD38_024313 [Melastoma candidum]|uniref:Uncharacterized protein n=1 Tax=Melastoma candidum TaxID=119954 RepID=A0ACB9NWX8_9MYRT|nr:hypothetical protein MLD38_024313 [Melastoma candidum]